MCRLVLTFQHQILAQLFDLLAFPEAVGGGAAAEVSSGTKLQRPDKGSSSASIVRGLRGGEINNQTQVKLVRLDFSCCNGLKIVL